MTDTNQNSHRGFSLIEMMLVCAIMLVMAAMAAPLVMNITNTYRLRSAGGEFANLLQTARIRAVVGDTYEPVYATTGSLYGGYFNAFVDLNQQGGTTGTYANTPIAEPATVFSNVVSIQPASAAPNTANLETQYLNGASSGTVAINENTWAGSNTAVVTFGARGLPCYLTSAAPNGGGGTCSYTFNNAGTPEPVAFEIYFENQVTNIWEAVTVNPSGRVREWRYDTPSGTWMSLN